MRLLSSRYTEFRKNVLDNLDKTEFDKAICEAMLNQKYFNGVGNYLRAEVLYRAGVAPFAKARDALQHLSEAEEGGAPAKKKAKKEEDLLYLCNVVMREVLDLSGNPVRTSCCFSKQSFILNIALLFLHFSTSSQERTAVANW